MLMSDYKRLTCESVRWIVYIPEIQEELKFKLAEIKSILLNIFTLGYPEV